MATMEREMGSYQWKKTYTESKPNCNPYLWCLMMDKTKAFISFSSRIHRTEKEPTAQVYKRTHKATKTSSRMIPRIKNMVHNERTWSASWSRICSPSTQLFCLCLQPSPPLQIPSFSLFLFFFPFSQSSSASHPLLPATHPICRPGAAHSRAVRENREKS